MVYGPVPGIHVGQSVDVHKGGVVIFIWCFKFEMMPSLLFSFPEVKVCSLQVCTTFRHVFAFQTRIHT